MDTSFPPTQSRKEVDSSRKKGKRDVTEDRCHCALCISAHRNLAHDETAEAQAGVAASTTTAWDAADSATAASALTVPRSTHCEYGDLAAGHAGAWALVHSWMIEYEDEVAEAAERVAMEYEDEVAEAAARVEAAEAQAGVAASTTTAWDAGDSATAAEPAPEAAAMMASDALRRKVRLLFSLLPATRASRRHRSGSASAAVRCTAPPRGALRWGRRRREGGFTCT